jgi:NifU-like protein involved in Fe-S cluster formation
MEKAVDIAPVPQVLCGHAGPPPGQGPFISIRLTITGDRVQSASYETYQCPGCQACAKAICALATGKTIVEAGAIKHPDLLAAVGPLPRHRAHCYGLALLALTDALRQAV